MQSSSLIDDRTWRLCRNLANHFNRIEVTLTAFVYSIDSSSTENSGVTLGGHLETSAMLAAATCTLGGVGCVGKGGVYELLGTVVEGHLVNGWGKSGRSGV